MFSPVSQSVCSVQFSSVNYRNFRVLRGLRVLQAFACTYLQEGMFSSVSQQTLMLRVLRVLCGLDALACFAMI